MRSSWLWKGMTALALCGCADRDAGGRADDLPSAVRPAGETASAAGPADVPGPVPAQGAIDYGGFGPARFGGTPEEVRTAWGRELVGGPDDPDGCYYLYPEARAQSSYRIAFMFENRQFVRLDVDAAGIAAPGGGEVGMQAAAIRARYPGITEQPHKYLEGGRYLRHVDAGGSVLVFELDPSGKVTQWRMGVPPQVDYVEGCG